MGNVHETRKNPVEQNTVAQLYEAADATIPG